MHVTMPLHASTRSAGQALQHHWCMPDSCLVLLDLVQDVLTSYVNSLLLHSCQALAEHMLIPLVVNCFACFWCYVVCIETAFAPTLVKMQLALRSVC